MGIHNYVVACDQLYQVWYEGLMLVSILRVILMINQQGNGSLAQVLNMLLSAQQSDVINI
jgi:hypothetical protein